MRSIIFTTENGTEGQKVKVILEEVMRDLFLLGVISALILNTDEK